MFGNLFESQNNFWRRPEGVQEPISLTSGMLMSLYMKNATAISEQHNIIGECRYFLRTVTKEKYPEEKIARGVVIGELEKARKQLKKLVALQYALKAEYRGKC